jgi:hypothetical protein
VVLFKEVLEIAALHPRHYKADEAVFFDDTDNRDDMALIEGGLDLGFTGEALANLRLFA